MSIVNVLGIEAASTLDGVTLLGGTDISNPAGTKIAFASNGNYGFGVSGYHIYVKDIEANTVQRADISTAGGIPNGASVTPVLSADGTKVMFYSTANNIVAGDTNARGDLFVTVLATGVTTRVTESALGVQSTTDNSVIGQFTPDGSKVIFASQANNLVDGDTNNLWDIFIKDIATGSVQLLSATAGGTQANGQNYLFGTAIQNFNLPSMNYISEDGTKIVFYSTARNLDPADIDAVNDIYVKNLTTGEVALVAVHPVGLSGGFSRPTISLDGNSVAFTNTGNGFIYVKNLTTGVLDVASKNASGTSVATNTSSGYSLSADGSLLLFSTAAALVAGDTNTKADIYMRDLVTGELQLISQSISGANLNDNSYNPVFSKDGRTVTFETTATNHGFTDSNGLSDVLVFHLSGPAINGDENANSLTGTAAWEEFHGLEGNDTIYGNGGNDTAFGEAGNDALFGGTGRDSLDGGNDNDTLDGGEGADTLLGGAGYDSILGGNGNDTIDAGGFNDTADGGAGNDSIFGSGGDDSLTGGTGTDSIQGGTGHDTVDGGDDGDYILGHNGNDVLFGGLGNDSIYGNNDNDNISGGEGDDYITGDAGSDTITGGLGIDTMFGGAGADIFAFSDAAESTSLGNVARDTIADFVAGTDKLDFSGFAGTLTFLGMAAPFTGAGNEVNGYQSTGPGVAHTIVSIDVDGDRTADIMLNLNGVITLNATDFIL